ncbi:MAG: hypothetical protein AB7I27_10860 [Bacteriovoracaceae bacterium]
MNWACRVFGHHYVDVTNSKESNLDLPNNEIVYVKLTKGKQMKLPLQCLGLVLLSLSFTAHARLISDVSLPVDCKVKILFEMSDESKEELKRVLRPRGYKIVESNYNITLDMDHKLVSKDDFEYYRDFDKIPETWNLVRVVYLYMADPRIADSDYLAQLGYGVSSAPQLPGSVPLDLMAVDAATNLPDCLQLQQKIR